MVACDVFILAPAESCAISFNVTECGDNDLLAVAYTGGANAQDAVYVSVSWFNSRVVDLRWLKCQPVFIH